MHMVSATILSHSQVAPTGGSENEVFFGVAVFLGGCPPPDEFVFTGCFRSWPLASISYRFSRVAWGAAAPRVGRNYFETTLFCKGRCGYTQVVSVPQMSPKITSPTVSCGIGACSNSASHPSSLTHCGEPRMPKLSPETVRLRARSPSPLC